MSANVINRRSLAAFASGIVLALVALMAWALASPVGSTPDDDFHLSSIWCGVGEREGLCAIEDGPGEREIAEDLVLDAVCYAYDGEKSAACQGDDFGTQPEQTTVSDRNNSRYHLYPPVFYFVMGLFAGPDVQASVILMRVVNVVIFVGLAAAITALVPRPRRTGYLWGLAITLVPLGMFLLPSTNPSSWALTSAAVTFAAMLGYFQSAGRARIGLGAIAAVGAVLGAGARADAAVFAGFAIVLAGFLAYRPSRVRWPVLILPIALLIGCGISFLVAGQSSALSSGLTPVGDSEVAPLSLVLPNLLQIPDLWVGVFGHWGLGWLDTPLPAVVWVGASAAFVGSLAIALARVDRRQLVAIGAVLAALVLVPLVLLVQSRTFVGAYVQPRYIMPLIVILAMVWLFRTGDRPALTRLQLVAIAGPVVVANALALHANIRRYTTGTDVGGLSLEGEWWWSIPIGPTLTWAIGSLAFAGLIALLCQAPWRAAPRQEFSA